MGTVVFGLVKSVSPWPYLLFPVNCLFDFAVATQLENIKIGANYDGV